jgi:hypothetical protein
MNPDTPFSALALRELKTAAVAAEQPIQVLSNKRRSGPGRRRSHREGWSSWCPHVSERARVKLFVDGKMQRLF